MVFKNKVEEKQVLDPRVAYLMTSLMEEVLRTGTAAGVRARYNLNVPAAGKTGTSHDGWFAGYTIRTAVRGLGGLRRQPRTQSGRRALGRAHLGGVHEAGAAVSANTATPSRSARRTASSPSTSTRNRACRPRRPVPTHRAEVYISGTQPVGVCPLHGGGRPVTNVAGWDIAPAGRLRPRRARRA